MQLPDFSKCKVLVVGDVMLDRYWFGDVSRISPEAPVPVVQINKMDARLGGAANVALNIRSLGGDVHLMSVIGKDSAGAELRALLSEAEIASTLYEDDIDTTIKLRVIARQQQLMRIDFEKNPSHELLKQSCVDFEKIALDFDVITFSDYGKGGLTHISDMIAFARRHQKIVVADPKGEDYSRYVEASLITPNRSEFRAVVGGWKDETTFRQKAQKLREDLKLEALLVTRSEEGMTLFLDREVIHQSARAKEVYDVSGAGDTVTATISLMRGCGMGWQNALQAANCAAGIVVGKLGTASVTREELARDLAVNQTSGNSK